MFSLDQWWATFLPPQAETELWFWLRTAPTTQAKVEPTHDIHPYYFLLPGEGGSQIHKWHVCNRRTKTQKTKKLGAFGEGCCWKKGHWVWIPQNWAFFCVNFPNRASFSVNWVKFERKLAIFSWKFTQFRNACEAREKFEILHTNFEKKGLVFECGLLDFSEKRSHIV